MLIQATPTKIYLPDNEAFLAKAKELLTYHDKTIDFQLKKFKRADWFRQRHGEEAYQDRLDELKAQRMKCLVELDEHERPYTYSGFADFLADRFETTVDNKVQYPSPKALPWYKAPPYQMYSYQAQALEKLLAIKHGAVSIATGLGKSFIIVNVIKKLGLKTLVMTPSTSISEQLYKELLSAYGPARVGAYFDGKKQFKKQIVVANGQSLVRLDPDSPAYQELSKCQVFISDESHCTPAATFKTVCFGVAENAPYRFFFSATQMRNDGSGLLLQGITGPIVYEMSAREGVDGGYLAKPVFRMIDVESNSSFDRDDAIEMTRQHLFYNDSVNKIAADIANKSVSLLGHPVLILVEEMEQFTKLYPYLRHKVAFAHGGVTKDNADKLPVEFHKSNPNQLVEQFNAGEIPILIGTSCVSTGTNFKAVKTLIYLQGGKSEIQVRQAIGRSTRLVEGKTTCAIYDFHVTNINTLSRHAMERKAIYNDIYGPVQEVIYG